MLYRGLLHHYQPLLNIASIVIGPVLNATNTSIATPTAVPDVKVNLFSVSREAPAYFRYKYPVLL